MSRSLILFLLNLIIAFPAMAQRIARYDTAEAKDLIKAAGKYDANAVTELGRRRERSAIELLKRIAEEADVPEPPAQAYLPVDKMLEAHRLEFRNLSHLDAKIALARMGEGNYFDEFVVGLSSSNVDWREKCIKYLGEIGDKRAVQYIIPLLDDPATGPRPPVPHFSTPHHHIDRVFPLPVALVAQDYLVRQLPDVAAQLDQEYHAKGGKGGAHILAWKDWWSKHHGEYGK